VLSWLHNPEAGLTMAVAGHEVWIGAYPVPAPIRIENNSAAETKRLETILFIHLARIEA
jgi:hypothetical protein